MDQVLFSLIRTLQIKIKTDSLSMSHNGESIQSLILNILFCYSVTKYFSVTAFKDKLEQFVVHLTRNNCINIQMTLKKFSKIQPTQQLR